MRRPLAVAIVLGVASAAAFAVGNGSVVATPPVEITQTTGAGGSGSATLSNTTSSSIQVALAPDVSCDPDVGLVVAGGDTFTLAPDGMQPIGLTCGPAQPPGIERCVIHATNPTTGDALVDLMGVCEDATGTQLVPSPASLSFGTVTVGASAALPLVLTNASASPITKLFLQTDDLDGDFILSAPCNPDAPYCDGAIPAVPPNGSATVLVSCSPHSPGSHTAQLEIATDAAQRLSQSVALDCTGTAAATPVLGISPESVVVAQPVEVTSGQAQTIVRLSNLGTGTLQVTDVRVVDVVIGASSDWTFALQPSGACTVLPCSLAAGAEVDLAVTFDPSLIARRDASLLVSYNDTVDRTHSIPLAGTGLGATLAGFGTSALDFGEVPVGHTSMLTFQLLDGGNRNTTPMLSTMPAGPIDTTAGSITVSPTMPATVTATCTPAAGGTSSATITAQSTDTLTTTPVTIAATCTGITTPLFADPSALALGEVRTGIGPQSFTITIDSTGAPLTLSGQPSLDVANPNVAVGTLSSQTTPATVVVTVDPTTVGGIATDLVIADTAGDMLRVPIAASIASAAYTAPATLSVGTFCVGQPTAAASTSLLNSGTATLGLSAPSLPGTSPFQLAFDAPTLYPISLPPDDSAIIAVTPERQSSAVTLTDTLTWTTDDAAQPTASTLITAQFVGSGGAIAPPSLDFGKVPVHLFVDDGQRVILQNCNTSALNLDAPTIKAPFSIDSPNFPKTLAPNETATFSIGFHPTSLGVFSQTFSITSAQLGSAQALQVTLVGDSVSTTPPGTDAGVGSSAPGDTNFYACSCAAHDPRGGWPIVLALALLIWPRRRGSS
ncbi:MAG TPA: choice-of-anchor D domain-containing protein [Kofleriaceae bacterium]|jgi:hypothetical protein